jgi:hypothetical protein
MVQMTLARIDAGDACPKGEEIRRNAGRLFRSAIALASTSGHAAQRALQRSARTSNATADERLAKGLPASAAKTGAAEAAVHDEGLAGDVGGGTAGQE